MINASIDTLFVLQYLLVPQPFGGQELNLRGYLLEFQGVLVGDMGVLLVMYQQQVACYLVDGIHR